MSLLGLEPQTFGLLVVGVSQLGHADLQRGGHAFQLYNGNTWRHRAPLSLVCTCSLDHSGPTRA